MATPPSYLHITMVLDISSHTSDDDNDSIISTDSDFTITSNSSNDDEIIEELVMEKLGPVDDAYKYHGPYTIASFLAKHRNSSTVNGNKITVFKVIKFFIKYDMVPIRTTTLYKLSTQFKIGKILIDATWSDLSRRGRKAYLNPLEFMSLIRKVKKETSGGKAMSSKELKEMIETHIVESFVKRKMISELPIKI